MYSTGAKPGWSVIPRPFVDLRKEATLYGLKIRAMQFVNHEANLQSLWIDHLNILVQTLGEKMQENHHAFAASYMYTWNPSS